MGVKRQGVWFIQLSPSPPPNPMSAAKILAVDPEVHPDNFDYEALISAKFVSENEQDQKQIDGASLVVLGILLTLSD